MSASEIRHAVLGESLTQAQQALDVGCICVTASEVSASGVPRKDEGGGRGEEMPVAARSKKIVVST